ncbi:hypothetical protein OsI_21322 [Oryza sativa Indica Group]|nr:hypothetical protein OsI_21322 [Oryza sativa Indica Group]
MATIVAWESRNLQLQGGGGGHGGGGGGGGGERREYMFEKVVTPSDVGKLNRLVVPKHYAEKYFPLGPAARTSPAGTVLCFEDARGGDSTWRFRYSYWSSSQSYVITKGWSRYVRDKRLAAGDTVSFCRAGARLFIDCRKRAASVSSSSLVPPALIKVRNPSWAEYVSWAVQWLTAYWAFSRSVAGSLCSMAPLRGAKRRRRRLQWRRPLRRVACPEQIARRIDADGAPGESTALRARSYGCIRVFLVLSLLLLAVEVAAYL